MGVKFLTFVGVSFLTFKCSYFLRLGVSNSYVGGLDFLRLGSK